MADASLPYNGAPIAPDTNSVGKSAPCKMSGRKIVRFNGVIESRVQLTIV